ncbi:MAG: hypothetical protein ACTSQP_01645 [Promethearchaeota archaeon]
MIFLSLYLLAFAYKHRDINKYGFNSTIVTAICLLIIGVIVLIFDLIPYPINAAINVWLAIVFVIQGIYFIIIKIVYKEQINKENIDVNTYENGEIKLKREYMRKSFHSVVILVVICYFMLALIINDFVYNIYVSDPDLYYSIWKTHEYPLNPKSTSNLEVTIKWTLMFFISALIFLTIPDIFRIYNRKYSIFSGVYKRVIRLKEFYTLGPQVYLTLGCTFTFLLAVLGIFIPAVAIAGMMIAAFGDAAAAIIGRRFGKHKFQTFIQREELKSYEGLIAGFIVSYISAFFFVGPIFAILGALTFSILDYLNPKIADNILNPILCTITMMIPFWIILY